MVLDKKSGKKSAGGSTAAAGDDKDAKNPKMKADKHKPLTKQEMKEKKAAKKAKQSEHLKSLWGA